MHVLGPGFFLSSSEDNYNTRFLVIFRFRTFLYVGLLLWGINDSKPEKGFLKRCLDPLYLWYGGSCEWAIWVEVRWYGCDEGNGWIIRTGDGNVCLVCFRFVFEMEGWYVQWAVRVEKWDGGGWGGVCYSLLPTMFEIYVGVFKTTSWKFSNLKIAFIVLLHFLAFSLRFLYDLIEWDSYCRSEPQFRIATSS